MGGGPRTEPSSSLLVLLSPFLQAFPVSFPLLVLNSQPTGPLHLSVASNSHTSYSFLPMRGRVQGARGPGWLGLGDPEQTPGSLAGT